MPRLPQPGGDEGNWGSILNEYLSQAHKSDGTLKDSIVTASVLAPGAVSAAVLQANAVTANALQTPAGAINGQVLTLDSAAPGGFKWSSIASTAQVQVDWNATSGVAAILNKPTLGTAAATNASSYATAAQGAKADSAVQPGGLAQVATSGSYADLANKPTIPAQFAPVAGTGVAITGTYPNMTFSTTSTSATVKVYQQYADAPALPVDTVVISRTGL